MAQVEATTERIIAADPETVFDALADYTDTRPKLLSEHFSEYEVREGGDGEGTLVHWKLQATSKRIRDCVLEVTEPTDGQLVEKDRNSSMVTTWTVTPAGEGRSKTVVTTVWDGAGGIGGFFERTFAPKGLGRIYDVLLGKLAAQTEGTKGAGTGTATGDATVDPGKAPETGTDPGTGSGAGK
jgi:uncharacterized protein YndB with AHSA1/START domain